MEKEKTPFVPSIILCFNPSFYPLVLRQSCWRSLGYLAVICLIVYGFLGLRERYFYQRDEEVLSEFYEEGIPDFHFENGEADYPPDNPHVYEEGIGEGLWAIVVDTSGKSAELDEKYKAGVLITKTEIIFKPPNGEARTTPIPKTDKAVAARELFLADLRMRRPLPLVIYIINLVGKLLLLAAVSGVLVLADKGKAISYPFVYYFNVGCYAITPFVLGALARGWQRSPFLVYASYGASLMLFLALVMMGLAKCRQEDARELAGAGIEEARTG
jgi:hypothetical protein